MKSRIIRGVSKNARFFVVNSTDVVQKALDIHHCSPTSIVAFGKFLTAGLIMGASLKGDDLLSLITNTDGPVNNMVVTANANGQIKGYLSNPQKDLPLKALTKQPDIENLIGKGSLRVIKDMGLKEPYVGLSEIQKGDIKSDMEYYYEVSEQTPTIMELGIKLSEDNKTIKFAGGYMLQLFPGADKKFIASIIEKMEAIRSITELFEGGMDLERIVKLLYEDMSDEKLERLIENYEILEEKEVSYYCDCNKNKYYKGLLTLGKKEILSLLEELNGVIETQCHFCGKKYQFTREDFKDFLEDK